MVGSVNHLYGRQRRPYVCTCMVLWDTVLCPLHLYVCRTSAGPCVCLAGLVPARPLCRGRSPARPGWARPLFQAAVCLAGLVRFSKPETLYVTYAKLSISDICAVTKPKLSMAKLHRRNCLQFVCMAKLDRLLTLNKTASPHPTQNYPSNAYKPHRSIHIYIYIMF